MKTIRIPAGTRDVLPSEAAELRRLEEIFRGVFTSFGYGEVITPTLELECAVEASGETRLRRSFRLFDEQGEVLMLRQEMTTPIARLVATKMADQQPPFRLCYFANAFRPTSPQLGRRSEFRQAGLEFIGQESPAVDGEVLAALCMSLEACGLKDFSLAIGEASFLRALLDEVGVTDYQRAPLFEALAARDMVALSRIVAALDIDADDGRAIEDVVTLRGDSEVLTRANDLVRGPVMEAALKRLARTYYLVSRFGYAERILFDFGTLRDFDYYTGIVFEVLSGGIGFPVGGGGRYNNLLGRFGRPAPAVGFAVGLDRLHIAISGQGSIDAGLGLMVVLAGGLDEELDLACELREAGVSVTALAAGASETEAIAAAGNVAAALAIVPVDGGFKLIDVARGGDRQVSREELAAAIGG